MLREAPTVIIFPKVKLSEFKGEGYQVHVFIYDSTQKEEKEEKEKYKTADDIDYESDNYVGGISIFSRSSDNCDTCSEAKPIDMVVDITKYIKKLGISRYNVKTKVYLQGLKENKLISITDMPQLPQPIVTGPLFEKLNDEYDIKTNKHEVEALQRYLQQYGYYEPDKKIDGVYGKITEQAVKDFQKASGINDNGMQTTFIYKSYNHVWIEYIINLYGVADVKTRNAIVHNKRCANKDGFAANTVKDEKSDINEAKYKGKKEITYKIGKLPGYLKRKQVSECINKVCKQYSDASDGKLSFKEIIIDDGDEKDIDDKNIDIKFDFIKFKSIDDVLKYDGPGSILGYGGIGFVQFDLAEKWIIGDSVDDEKELSDINDIKTWKRGRPVLSLYYTALHELGHSLGLQHSMNAKDLMSPWYDPKIKTLTENDKKALKKVLG